MLRKSARVLIGTVLVELALLALLVLRFGVSLPLVIGLVVGGTALGMLISMRQVGQLFGPAQRSPATNSSGRSTTNATSDAGPADLASSVSDGAMRAVAGLLLAFPGLLTGAAGLLLLAPPVRRALRPALWGWFSRLLPVEVRSLGNNIGADPSFQDLFSQATGSSPFGPGTGRSRRGDVVDVDVASTEPDSSGNPSSAPPELR